MLGGLVGENGNDSLGHTNSYWNTETTGQSSSGSFGSGNSFTEIEFRAHDFSTIWPFGETTESPWSDDDIDSYPIFSWLGLSVSPIDPQIVKVGYPLSVPITVQSQTPFDFSFTGVKPIGLQMTAEDRIMWTPFKGQEGEHVVRVLVSNESTSKVVVITILVGDYKPTSTVNISVVGTGQLNGESSLSFEMLTGTDLPPVTAIAGSNYEFFGYRGDYVSDEPVISSLMVTEDMEIEAFFDQDSDQNGIPDSWEDELVNKVGYVGNLTVGGDVDGDGISDYIEFLRDTNPFVFNIIMYPGWNLIHIPNTLTVVQNDLDTIFQNHLFGMLWGWTTAGYQQITSLTPGIGIWAFWDGEEEAISIPGVPANQQKIGLKDEWNLVGVVQSEVVENQADVSRVFESDPAGSDVEINAVFYWNATEQIYKPLDPTHFEMMPGVGYWILSDLSSTE